MLIRTYDYFRVDKILCLCFELVTCITNLRMSSDHNVNFFLDMGLCLYYVKVKNYKLYCKVHILKELTRFKWIFF